MKAALFPCLGLGDGLIAAILANNLLQAGHEVDTYHPLMGQLQAFFPGMPLYARPDDLSCLDDYDRIFVIYEKLDYMQKVLGVAPEKTVILNPIATPNRDYPYWEIGRFDGTRPFAVNLAAYCRDQLGILQATKANGLVVKKGIEKNRFESRVIIHPTSSRPGKNWSKEQFLQLSSAIEKEGFEPKFILTKEERLDWPEVDAPSLSSLEEVALYVAESGLMIGNDSGVGHLASCLGLPTLTICRSKMSADFWRPAWSEGRVICPPKWVPNLKGMRWRDQKWQRFVSVKRVVKEFLDLAELGVLRH